MHLTAPLVLEYEAKLLDKSHLTRLSESEVVDLVDAICASGVLHSTTWFSYPLFVRDPGDTFVLDAVMGTPATTLVTSNIDDFESIPSNWPSHPAFTGADSWNVSILEPIEYWRRIR
jgi:predicted nucleic acid-binding protein